MTTLAAMPLHRRIFRFVLGDHLFATLGFTLGWATLWYAWRWLNALPRRPDDPDVMIRFGDLGYFNMTTGEALILGGLLIATLLTAGMVIGRRLWARRQSQTFKPDGT